MSKATQLTCTVFLTLLGLILIPASALHADDASSSSESKSSSSDRSDSKEKSKFDQLTEGMTKREGMWTTYSKDQKLYIDMKSSDMSKEYIVLTSIAQGISQGWVLGGMSWSFGDEIIWTFKQVGDKVHVIRRNVRFRAKPDSPESSAVRLAYSDSVLYALPILTKTPGGQLVDVTQIFMSDDQQIGQYIGFGFRFAGDRSTFSAVKPFKKNLEIDVAAIYSGPSSMSPDLLNTVADTRGVQIRVHYSISELPKVGSNGYKPRKADDRVGYFLTVLKDFSDREDDQHFVRYITRWHLKKKDPSIKLSPPEEPIRFYIEKTVPIWLRPTVKAGILEWNKAFQDLGYAGAIEVLQQEDDAEWDPEDINYNTFRWMTADAPFAMGPSRVDPRTGQILDADIIFDASFLEYWKQDYETLSEKAVERLRPNWTIFDELQEGSGQHQHRPGAHCMYCTGMQHQMGFAAAALAGSEAAKKGELPEEFIHQGLKEVVMHEVGHTLGLRHNFKASAWKTLEEITSPERKPDEPLVASVMDYNPALIAPPGKEQGLYFTQTIGPYDRWAIEYGYKPISGSEDEELKKIASRSGEPGLDFATDEDTRNLDSDPYSNRFDLGSDPVVFAQQQMAHAADLLPKVVDRSVSEGEGYQRARQAFGLLLSEYWRTALFASRLPGGVIVNRDHKGDEKSRPPFQIVDAKAQRDAMDLLSKTVLASPSYDGQMLNHLAATRWSHWGINEPSRLDYPIHETIARMQGALLRQLFDSTTLRRLQDNEVKVAGDADAYTLAEHLRRIVDGVFTEWDSPKTDPEPSDRNPLISSYRRGLQRETINHLARLVVEGNADFRRIRNMAPEDARTLARMHLQALDQKAEKLLTSTDLKPDDYTRAHLIDSQARIRQVLSANLEVRSVD
ncbi:MAG: zinc-dependent metalloprotease [Planctomycetaceae bacterium]|nr:zinc-dependent metalloprotease [Planctomycetaceae bacterium]